ncbi:APC5 protein, partial [Linderina pennispora]
MSDSVYLSPAKLLLLVAIEQYSLHYDWGPTTLSDIADILVTYLCEPERQVDLEQLGRDMATISVPSELQQQPQSLQSILHYRISELTELEQFTQFFDSLRVLVVYAETQEAKDDEAILLDSESIFGIFVRRCVLAFEQLEFHQTGKFHNACIAATTAPKLKTSKPSQHELQDLVDHQIRLLENETGAAVPTDMASKIHGLIDALPGYAHAHYLDYLRLARTGEYEQSEASLRRFFDSSAMAQSKYGFQYALLYLAVLRTRLGLVAEAQQALDEALHTARDLQDHTCRVYVTIWQARLQYVKYKHGQSEPATVRASLEGLIASATNMQLREM